MHRQTDLDKLFKEYDVQENIDILHTIVNQAKERKAKGDIGKDVWREGLKPRAAVCARTVPMLEAEAKKLRSTLAAVSIFLSSFRYLLNSVVDITLLILLQMEDENQRLQAQLEDDVRATNESHDGVIELMDKLDKVQFPFLLLISCLNVRFPGSRRMDETPNGRNRSVDSSDSRISKANAAFMIPWTPLSKLHSSHMISMVPSVFRFPPVSLLTSAV